MLNIGNDSRCDICLEAFDNGRKNPHAIRCGHMFCADCIGALAQSPTHVYPMNACPLCRQPFSLISDVWKLHVDVDSRSGTTGQRRTDSSGAQPTPQQEEEAQQLRQSFITIATEGADEARTRGVLQSITDFVRPLPREMFWDLRMVARLLAYTCDVRSKNRSMRSNLTEKDRKIAELTTEAGEWKKRYEGEKSYRQEKQKAAEASEKELKQYILSLSKTYEATVGHYNFVVDEWMKQNEEMKNIRAAFSELRDQSNSANIRAAHPPSPPITSSNFYVNHADYESRLSGTVMTNPGSLLVSPLPEFTSLPTNLFSCPLSPDEDELSELELPVDSNGAEASSRSPKRECELLSPPNTGTSTETAERGVNTRRLNDLLSDIPTPSVTSSSLPATSTFPPSFEAPRRERPRSHSNSHVSPPHSSSHSPPSRSRPEPAVIPPHPVPTPVPTPSGNGEAPQPIRVQAPIYDPAVYTSASAAAQAAEKAKRAKQRAGREADRGRPATPERDVTPKPARERQRDLSRQDSRRDYSKTQSPSSYKYSNGIHPPMLPPRDVVPNVSSGYSSMRTGGYSSRSQPKLQDVFSTDRHMTNPVPLGVSRG